MRLVERVLEKIRQERKRQDDKWGPQREHPDLLWNAILAEEVGEVSRAILERDRANLRDELVQVAAVAVCWLEAMDAEPVGEAAVCKIA